MELLDARERRYALRWIGFDGKEKKVTFQRADAVDVVVSATASKDVSGKYLYTYNVTNLPSSGAFIKRVIIQTLASDAEPKDETFMPGRMASWIRSYSEGAWFSFT